MHGDPDDTLRAAEAALAATEGKIEELILQRAAKLLEANYAGEVETIDRQIEAHRRAAVVHRDRIGAMIRKRRVDEHQRQHSEKADAIAEISKRLARRDAAAQRLEVALAGVSAAVADLLAADEAAFAGWPALLPNPAELNYLAAASMPALCRRDRRPLDHQPRVIVGPVRALGEGAADGLASEIQQKGVDLIEILNAVHVPEPAPAEDEVEAA